MDGSGCSCTEACPVPTATVCRGRGGCRRVQRAGPSPDAQSWHRPTQNYRGKERGHGPSFIQQQYSGSVTIKAFHYVASNRKSDAYIHDSAYINCWHLCSMAKVSV